jgi:hypothetical protein
MENNFNRRIQTDLDLNGPILSYTTQPSDVTKNKGDSVTFTVAATTEFPGNTAANDNDAGTITFQWSEVDTRQYRIIPGTPLPGGALRNLTNGGNISGATSASLTISNLDTPGDNARTFVCEISYNVGDEYDSADKGTGTALNAPLQSSTATLTINPLLEIVSQPSSVVVTKNNAAKHTISAKLTDNSGAVTYNWYVGVGNATPILVENKTYTTQNIEQETITVIIDDTVTDTNYYSESKSFGPGNYNVNIPPTGYNVSFSISGAQGGSGGSDSGGAGGGGGNGRYGSFTIPNGQAQGQPFSFRIGSQGGGGGRGTFWSFGGAGGSNIAPGGRGGGAGPRGWSGGGGGGGGASGVVRGSTLIASAGGGGGGGGGSWNRPASGGYSANNWFPYNGGTIRTYSGGTGGDCPSDGGGGGGGGGGSGGPAGGGHAGFDNAYGGGGGGGGNSDYRSDIVNLSRSGGNGGNGNGYIAYNYTTTSTRPVKTPRDIVVDKVIYQNAVISGQGSDTLSITVDETSFNTDRKVYCVVSASASNSPLTSDTVISNVVDIQQQKRVIIETISADGTANIQETDLSNGEQEFVAGASSRNTGDGGYLYSIYAPDRDVDIEMDLYGGKGISGSYGGAGGDGGYSRIRFTLERNTEYIIAGLTNSINTPFIYRRASLIAVVGQGGGGNLGNGGKGGGIGLAGRGGTGGVGGPRIPDGTLGSNGVWSQLIDPPTGVYVGDTQVSQLFPTAGGRTIKCTKGDYWARQGYSPCDVVPGIDATSKFRMADGSEVSNTGSITRGYKDGYAIQYTGGLGRADNTRESAVGPPEYPSGGNGATGGTGGFSRAGGGGGSGYTDGSVQVVDTQLGGGSSDKAKVIMRLDLS